MNDDFTETLAGIGSRTVTVRAPDGHTLVETKALHALAVGLAGIVLAPRVAAAAALAALVGGVTVAVSPEQPAPGEMPIA